MMDSENHTSEEHHHPLSPREEMESLALHDEDDHNHNHNDNDDVLSNNKSYSNYRSVMSTLSETHHPLYSPIVPTPAKPDPLLAPSHHHPHREFPNPNSNSHDLDPPSYADAVFIPFDSETASNGVDSLTSCTEGLSLSRSLSSSSESLRITVSNPVKEQENSNSIVLGGSSYVTYLITTRTNLLEFGGSEFAVRWRFRDIVTLADRLSEAYRGFFIPPRPDKSIVESQVMQKQEFVEQRRVAVEVVVAAVTTMVVMNGCGGGDDRCGGGGGWW